MKGNTAKLAELCHIQSGGTPRRGIFGYYGGTIPWVKISDMESPDGIVRKTEETITQEGLDAINNRLFSPGTLLLAMYGSVGKVAIAGKELSTNQAIVGITIKDKKLLDDRYLYRWLIAKQSKLIQRARGVTLQNISAEIVKDLVVPMPPIEEQRRIATILDKADEIYRKRQAMASLVNEIQASVFNEMFGDPVSNSKGWPRDSFGNLGELDRGRSRHRPRNAPKLYGGPYPFIQTGDVSNCQNYIREYQQTYSELGLQQSRLWKAGTLCITIAANIAKTGILTFDACFPDSIVGFQPSDRVSIEYVHYWLKFMQQRIEKAAPESAQKNINLEILRKLSVPVPPIALQKKFSRIVSQTNKLSQQLDRSMNESENMFNSLQKDLF